MTGGTEVTHQETRSHATKTTITNEARVYKTAEQDQSGEKGPSLSYKPQLYITPQMPLCLREART